MKKSQLLVLLISTICILFTIQELSAQDKKKSKETVTFFVEGMHCKNCQAKIEKNIAFEKGVTDLKCNLETKTVEVTYKSDKTDPEKIAKGFEKIGMPAKIVPAETAESQE